MNKVVAPALSSAARQVAQSEAEKILRDTTGVSAVVIATVDGFDVASAVTAGHDPSRIAAMASSISAISYVVSEEAKLGKGKRVIIETDAGFAVVYNVPRADIELVVIVVCDGRTLLAQVAYQSAAAAKLLLEAA